MFSFVTIHAADGQTDRRTDRQTDGQTDGHNSDSNTVRCITCSRTVKTKNSLFQPPFWALRGNVRTPSMADWKARGRLYIRCNWTFRYLLRLRRYERKSVEVGVFRRGVGHFECRFQREGASPTNHCWCQKTRVIAVSCGIKIFAVLLSQYTHLTDRRTDGRTDGQNCDNNTVRCITCSRTVKMGLSYPSLSFFAKISKKNIKTLVQSFVV